VCVCLFLFSCGVCVNVDSITSICMYVCMYVCMCVCVTERERDFFFFCYSSYTTDTYVPTVNRCVCVAHV